MDSGWIKALELPAKITGGLFAACAVIWFLDQSATLNLNEIGAWLRPLIIIIWVTSGCLFVFSIIPPIWEATAGLRTAWRQRNYQNKKRQEFVDDIPYLTDKERIILGYLRHYKQKRFTGMDDAGYANTLLAKGYIRFIGVRGQAVSVFDVPYEVSNFVWEELEKRPDEFPHKPEYSSRPPKTETHPWRRPVI